MTNGFNDDLRNDINKLNRNIESLTRAVQKNRVDMDSAFRSNNQRHKEEGYGGVGIDRYSKDIADAILKAMKATGVQTYKNSSKKLGYEKGDVKSGAHDKVLKEAYSRQYKFAEFDEMAEQMGLNFKQVVESQEEFQKMILAITGNMDDANKVLAYFQQQYGDTSTAVTKLADHIKVVTENGERYYERIDSFISQARADVAKLSSTITETSTKFEAVNDSITNLAANSQAVSDILERMEQNVSKFGTSTDFASNAIFNQAVAIEAQTRNTVHQMTSFNQVVGSMRTTLNKLTNTMVSAQNKIEKAQQNISSGGGSTFRQQQVRNSDRAKQAGFIALLIPALAKLLKKTPATDIFRYMALRWGANVVRQGKKPVGPALAYMSAPLITGAIATALMSKTFRNGIGNAFSTLGGTFKNLPKGATSGGKITRWSDMPKMWGGFAQGWRDARSGIYTTNARLAMRKSALGYEDFQSMKLLQLSGNRSTYMPQGVKTTIQGQSYDSASRLYRNTFGRPVSMFPKWLRDLLGPNNSLTKMKIPALSAKMLKRVPILGTALSAAFEIPDLIKAKKSGDKEIWGQQLAKSVGGVTGGTVGAVAGGALGALAGPLAPIATPIGAMIGGLIGDAIGRTIGPQIRRGFQAVTEPIKGTFNELKKHTKGAWEGISKIFSGIGKIGSALGSLLSPLFNLAGMLGGVILKLIGRLLGMGVGALFNTIVTGLNNAMALIDWVVNGIGNMVQSFADGIKSFADMVKDAFHNLGQWLLTCPVIGPALQKALNQTPDDSTVEDATSPELTKLKKEHDNLVKEASLGKYKEGTLTYNNWHSELVQQYERANTKKTAGISITPKEVKEAAHVWATEQIAKKKAELDSLIKQNETKTAKVREAIGTAIPSTAVYKKVNGINAVDMNSLQLRGLIGSGNSVPYVASSNAQRLKLLDTYLANKGYKFTYTSAMGGSHAGGPNSHGQGQKVDLVLNNGGQLKANDVKWLKRMGFIGNGAVGWHNAGSGYHYDLSVSSGVKSNMASGSMTPTSTNTATVEAQEANMKASSELRDDLAKFIKYKDKNGKQERARNIIMSAVDVTGSLGVWGITQINNNGMRVGK